MRKKIKKGDIVCVYNNSDFETSGICQAEVLTSGRYITTTFDKNIRFFSDTLISEYGTFALFKGNAFETREHLKQLAEEEKREKEKEQKQSMIKYIEADALKKEVQKIIDSLMSHSNPSPLSSDVTECMEAAEIEALNLVLEIIDSHKLDEKSIEREKNQNK